MEGHYGSNNSTRAPKHKTMTKENISPLNPQNFIGKSRYKHYPSKSMVFDPYASSDSTNSPNSDSPLIKYLRSAAGESFKSPSTDISNTKSSGGFGRRGLLSAIENMETPTPVFNTPVKEEDDVLVMDGILVSSTPGAAKKKMMRSSSSSSSYWEDSSGTKGRLSSVTSLDLSCGTTSSGSNSSGYYNMETCWRWEDSGHCRFGSKCQFSHVREELRPTYFPNKNKNEAQISKSYSSGSSTYGTTGHIVHSQVTTAASPTKPSAAVVVSAPNQTVPIELEGRTSSVSSPTIIFRNSDWSPQDDGIEVALASCASPNKTTSWEEVDAHIHSVLYGPGRTKRLPVFAEICPE